MVHSKFGRRLLSDTFIHVFCINILLKVIRQEENVDNMSCLSTDPCGMPRVHLLMYRFVLVLV